MSILTSWFRRESTQVIVKAAIQILKVIAAGVGERLWNVAKTEVISVQNLPISNREKFEKVVKAIKDEFPGIKDYIANIAVELAVAYFKEAQVKK